MAYEMELELDGKVKLPIAVCPAQCPGLAASSRLGHWRHDSAPFGYLAILRNGALAQLGPATGGPQIDAVTTCSAICELPERCSVVARVDPELVQVPARDGLEDL